jgi:uncharacterized protein YbjT (DUF2867 family)
VKIILFGATGMVGQGVLRECLLDPEIEGVLSIGRTPTGQTHEKLREMNRKDMFNYEDVEEQLRGYDACFFCLGVSSVGMKEADYRRLTYDLTMAAGQALAKADLGMTFIYVSGTGTDSTERGRSIWARVKGATENALLRLPFKAAYMFRPGVIQPMHGERPKARLSRVGYLVMAPLIPLLIRVFPKYVTTTERMGRAMIEVAKHGAPKKLLETRDINQLALSLPTEN